MATHQAALSATLPAGVLPGSGAATAQAVVDGGTVYVSVPGLSALLGGAQWVSVTAPASDSANVASGFSQLAAALGDAQTIVTTLRSDGATVTSLGTRTVGGGTETGYRADIDLAKLLTAHGLPAATVQKATAAVGTAIPVTLWVDLDGRLAEVGVAVHATTASSATADVALTVDFTGYNTPVSITVPPATDTRQLSSSVLGQLAPMVSGQLGVSSGVATALSHVESALLGKHAVHPRTHHRHVVTA